MSPVDGSEGLQGNRALIIPQTGGLVIFNR
jgi:hypothetical protein